MRSQLDQVKDENLVFRSTLERRTMYKSMRMAEPRYVSVRLALPAGIHSYPVFFYSPGRLRRWIPRLVCNESTDRC